MSSLKDAILDDPKTFNVTVEEHKRRSPTHTIDVATYSKHGYVLSRPFSTLVEQRGDKRGNMRDRERREGRQETAFSL